MTLPQKEIPHFYRKTKLHIFTEKKSHIFTAKQNYTFLPKKIARFYRNKKNHTPFFVCACYTFHSMQTWARNLKDDYSYIQQDNMNRTMYVLTLITALFVPANFLTGLFGMNFEYMPWLNWEYGFWAFWGVIVCVNVVIVYLIKKLSWLQ